MSVQIQCQKSSFEGRTTRTQLPAGVDFLAADRSDLQPLHSLYQPLLPHECLDILRSEGKSLLARSTFGMRTCVKFAAQPNRHWPQDSLQSSIGLINSYIMHISIASRLLTTQSTYASSFGANKLRSGHIRTPFSLTSDSILVQAAAERLLPPPYHSYRIQMA